MGGPIFQFASLCRLALALAALALALPALVAGDGQLAELLHSQLDSCKEKAESCYFCHINTCKYIAVEWGSDKVTSRRTLKKENTCHSPNLRSTEYAT